MKILRKVITNFLVLAMIMGYVSIDIKALENENIQNVALNKTTFASNGNASRAVDGDKTTYWDGGLYPSEIFVDLGGYYDVSKIVVIPYYAGSRYYHYEVYISTDGVNYKMVGEKSNDIIQTSEGETYSFGTEVAKFVKVKMNYNSANSSVHINELEVYGVENKEYQPPEAPTTDPNDPDNIAYGKPTRTTTNEEFSSLIVDGQVTTSWSGEDYPKFVDIDLMENYDISKIMVYMPQGVAQFAYTVYGSIDGVHFEKIVATDIKESSVDGGEYIFENQITYRVIRINVTANSNGEGANSQISEVKIYGKESNLETVEIRTNLGIESYDKWLLENYNINVKEISDVNGEYDIKDTFNDEDVFKEVNGIISRILGEKYIDWFTFELMPSENGKDYYEISSVDGKVHIKGNEGISLTSGLNYFLKYYCNVHVSQQTKQVKMPENIPEIDGLIRKESPYEVRYAYNYCTLSYTMPFWGYDEWQRELDYFALNGVNLILDTTATEALWVEYLQNYGYDIEEAKAFVCGYAYKAWWLMGNLESYGGPVSDEWIIDTVEMARVNQRKMTVLGMQPCLQGFMGAMPENFEKVANKTLMEDYRFEDLHTYMVEQGDWSGFTRPPILKTTYDGYDSLAKEFYETQEYIYGQITDYYAGDLAHEGGVIPPDLSKPEMSSHILKQMMSYDSKAVWVIQSWLSNPDSEILEGFGENKEDHVLVLDLDATADPHWSNTTNWNGKEFGGTSWVFCMLDNYGGRTGMHGELEYLATQIVKANKESNHMKGIGITPEGTLLNPVNYDLFWEMAWESEVKDTKTWLKEYITRRYGEFSENTWEAWQILLSTAYGMNNDDGSAKYHTGNVNCITNMRPSFDPEIVIGDYELVYDPIKFEEAMNLMMQDFDKFKDNECYIYDIVDILRQTVSNSQVEFFSRIIEAYNSKNYEIFEKYKTKLLNSILLIDEIAGFEKDSLYGTWISKAINFYNDERNSNTYDDYSKDMMIINAKAIVNIWSSKTLQTYAHRQYSGLEKDYNYPMWELWLERLETAMETGNYTAPTSNKDYFNIGWNVVINNTNYTTVVKNPDGDQNNRGLKDIYLEICDEYLTGQAQKDAIIDENIASDGNAYADSSLGSYVASNINDNNLGTMWIAESAEVPVSVGISFSQQQEMYGLQAVFETRNPLGSNIMNFLIEIKDQNGNWNKIYMGQSYDENNKSYTIDIPFETPVVGDDIKITYESNGGIYPALCELKVYSSKGIQLIGGTSMFISNAILNGVPDNITVEELLKNLYIGSGTIQCVKDGTILTNNDTIVDGTSIQLIKNNVIIDELTVSLASNLITQLDNLLKQAKEIDEKLYSKLSYNVLIDAVSQATNIFDDPNSDSRDYKDAIILLQNAINNLVDISGLENKLKELENEDSNEYIEQYYLKYQMYYQQAKGIYDRIDVATKDEIYQAEGYLELAQNYLIHDENTNIAPLGQAYADNELMSAYGKDKINNINFEDCWVANSRTDLPVSGGVTLDDLYSVNYIKVAFEENGYRNTQLGFYVSVQDENNDWSIVYSDITGAKNGYTFIIDMKDKMIKDVKVTITSYATEAGSPYPGISEIEVYQTSDNSELKEILTLANSKIENGYNQSQVTTTSWNNFESIYKKAKSQCEKDTYTQTSIDKTCELLIQKLDQLTLRGDVTRLEEEVTECEKLKEEEYTSISWQEFISKLMIAKNIVLDNSDARQEDVDNALNALLDAKKSLLKVAENKTALQIAISMANEVTQEQLNKVVGAVANEFKTALYNAIAVNEDANVTQVEVNNAFDRLAKAMHMLDFIKGDKTDLINFIGQVSNLDGEYTPATWGAFNEALNAANEVVADENALQVDVEKAYKDLVTAFLDLRLIPNKDLLNDLINKAGSLEATNYSAASFKAMQEALANAKAVALNENATQAEVDNAKDVLAKAIANLQVNTPATDNKVTSVNNGDTTSIKTGDNNLINLLAGLSLLSAAGVSLLRRKEN